MNSNIIVVESDNQDIEGVGEFFDLICHDQELPLCVVNPVITRIFSAIALFDFEYGLKYKEIYFNFFDSFIDKSSFEFKATNYWTLKINSISPLSTKKSNALSLIINDLQVRKFQLTEIFNKFYMYLVDFFSDENTINDCHLENVPDDLIKAVQILEVFVIEKKEPSQSLLMEFIATFNSEQG